MAITVSAKIINNTKDVIKFINISQVNDDATWEIDPEVGTNINPRGFININMGNNSFFPKGVGFNATFVGSNSSIGNIYLEIPAVGKYQFTTGGPFKINILDSVRNSYTIDIT